MHPHTCKEKSQTCSSNGTTTITPTTAMTVTPLSANMVVQVAVWFQCHRFRDVTTMWPCTATAWMPCVGGLLDFELATSVTVTNMKKICMCEVVCRLTDKCAHRGFQVKCNVQVMSSLQPAAKRASR